MSKLQNSDNDNATTISQTAIWAINHIKSAATKEAKQKEKKESDEQFYPAPCEKERNSHCYSL